MSEVATRTTGVIARAVGNTVSPFVTSMMMSAAVTTGNLELAQWANAAGAMAGSLTEEAVSLVTYVMRDKAQRVQEFADAAARESGETIESLVADAVEDRRVLHLLGESIQAATGAVDDWMLQTLAKAFVRGAKDGALVDEMRMLVGLLRGVEVADVRLLAVLATKGADGRRKTWLAPAIAEADAGLAAVLPVLLRKASTSELARMGAGRWELTEIGEFCADQLAEIGALDADS